MLTMLSESHAMGHAGFSEVLLTGGQRADCCRQLSLLPSRYALEAGMMYITLCVIHSAPLHG